MQKFLFRMLFVVTFMFIIIALSQDANCQTSVVSATVVDGAGQAFANGTYRIEYQSPAGYTSAPQRIDTGALLSNTDRIKTGTLDASGAFSATVIRSDNIAPAGSRWKIQVCPNAAPTQCTAINANITAASFNAAPPLLAAIGTLTIDISQVPSPPYAYRDTELVGQRSGSEYFNTVTNAITVWNGSSWNTYPNLGSNNTWNGSQTFKNFNGIYFASQYANLNAAFTAAGTTGVVFIEPSVSSSAATYTNTNQVDVIDFRNTVANSFSAYATIGMPKLFFESTTTGPPVPGAGLMNNYFDPRFYLKCNDVSGGVTGSIGCLYTMMYGVNKKQYTQTVGAITGSGIAQTIQVGDSSVFYVGGVGFIDRNISGSSETFTVTGIPDSTHITGVLTLNHTDNSITGTNDYRGTDVNLNVLTTDIAGSKADLVGANFNLICNALTVGACNGNEYDITNGSGYPAMKAPWMKEIAFGTTYRRPIFGNTYNIFGNTITAALALTTGDGLGDAWNVIDIAGSAAADGNGILFSTGGEDVHAQAPRANINIQAGAQDGIVIGSNQTSSSNSTYHVLDPVYSGLKMLARLRGTAGVNVPSNYVQFQTIQTSVNHTWDLYAYNSAGGFFFDQDTAGVNFAHAGFGNSPGINNDKGFENPVAYRLRDNTGTIKASFTISGTAAAIGPNNSGTLAVSATTLNVGGGQNLSGVFLGTATLTYGSIAAQTCAEQTITITGASTTNFGASASPRVTLGNVNLSWSAWVSASNTLSVRVCNPTVGAITPAAVAWGGHVIQ